MVQRDDKLPFREALRRRSTQAGLALLALLLLAGTLGPFFAPHDPCKPNLRERLASPSEHHLLGTDYVGRDVLSRLLTGLRYDLLYSAGIAATMVFLSLVLKALLRKRVRLRVPLWAVAVLGTVYVMALGPTIVLPIIVAVGQSEVIAVGTAALTLLPWAVLLALRSGGQLGSHLAAWGLSWFIAILLLAYLAFLGAGIPPPKPELGVMVSEGRNYVDIAWWAGAVPGLTMLLVILVVLLTSTYLLQRGCAASPRYLNTLPCQDGHGSVQG